MALIKASWRVEGKAVLARAEARAAWEEVAAELSGEAEASILRFENEKAKALRTFEFRQCAAGECFHTRCGVCGECLDTEGVHNDGYCKYLEDKWEPRFRLEAP